MEDQPTLDQVQIFPEASFFQEERASALPPPSEIRTITKQSGIMSTPPIPVVHRPVMIPSLGSMVKWGGNVTRTEVGTQILARKQLLGRVPIPEVYRYERQGGTPLIGSIARRGGCWLNPVYFGGAVQEWHSRYWPMILDPVDDEEYYNPWLWFVLSKGILI
ncbi:phosphotransferase enzyme family protein [Penicillium alfredii]|uniref:Phosphotransferase enzyme family protein n=1 Tax=Penicillium alfredii TaxID=1506179 RepID=A0A9W9JTK6_9EURO|nr:phosphotransferase enzyme family protein [Penicillium alfredii]KAJ5081358.1 phosphotransferase enzyme family protein [Penicillium alfredii]